MLIAKPFFLLLAAVSVELSQAHTIFTNFFVNGANQGDAVAVRMSNVMSQSTFPIKGITSDNVACGKQRHTLLSFSY